MGVVTLFEKVQKGNFLYEFNVSLECKKPFSEKY